MKKQNLLFTHQILKALGDAIINVFIPLYIIKQTNDFNLGIIYLIVYSIITYILMHCFKSLYKKHGVICIFFSFAGSISAQSILAFANLNIYSVLLVSLCMGIYQSLYSIPLNILFTLGDKKANVGKFQTGNAIGKVMFTLASGLILSSSIKNSFLILAIVSSTFYICSCIPLFVCYNELKEDYQIHDYKKEVKPKKDWLFTIFHIGFGIFQPVTDHLMPVYLYINNLSFQTVTIVIVAIEVGKIIANMFAQYLVSHNKAKLSLIISGVVFVSSILILIFNRTPIVLYIFSVLSSLSFPFTFVSMFHLFCNKIKEENYIFNGLINRDLEIFSGRPILYALSLTPIGMVPSFIFGLISIPIMIVSGLKILKRNESK